MFVVAYIFICSLYGQFWASVAMVLPHSKNAEIEAKLKKLKAQNDRYKKDRKRANQLATMLPEISFKDELDQLKKLTS